jgi:hypothetical protein
MALIDRVLVILEQRPAGPSTRPLLSSEGLVPDAR